MTNGEVLSGALALSARIASFGLCLTALEVAADHRSYAPGAVFGRAMVETVRGGTVSTALSREGGVVAVAALQLLASSVVVVAGPYSMLGRIALATSLVTLVTIRWRRALGGDGADHMSTVVVAAVALAVLPSADQSRVGMAVAFIAAQAKLSYATAGVAKLLSPYWRSGAAMPDILDTYAFGHAGASKILRARPRLTRMLTSILLLVEVGFPLLVLGPRPVVMAALAAALLFHVSCAVTMGLNDFLWAFPATFPCVWVIPKLFR